MPGPRLQRRDAMRDLHAAARWVLPDELQAGILQDRPGRDEALDQVMARRVISARTTKALAREMDTCAICLEGYSSGDEVACMPCLHKTHWKCVEQWLDRGASTCPTCRWTIPASGSDRPSLMETGESELDRLRWLGGSDET